MSTQTNKVWSVEQNEIIGWFRNGTGNLVVIARAGTGKTTTIIAGVEQAPERRILLAAFNKSIATELQTRIKTPNVEAKTLHGLGYNYVRRLWGNVNVDADGKRAADLAKAACGDAPYTALRLVAQVHSKLRECCPADSSPAKALELMVRYDLLPDDGLVESDCDAEWIAKKASRAVDLAKSRTPIIDFSDMIFLPVALNCIVPLYDLVVVDEAQDMTEAQLAIAMGACHTHGRIAIVGDNRQAIYGFRGADSNSLSRLKDTLNAAELKLTTTYRCPKRVVEIASQYVTDFFAADSAPEGVIENCNEDQMLASISPRDFILSRTNAPLVKVCMSLLKQGTKATIKGRDIGKGILSLVNKMKASGLPELVTKVRTWCEKECKKALKLSEEASQARIEYVTDQRDVCLAIAEESRSLNDLKNRLETLFSDKDDSAVMCSTTHRAKGLESDSVYLLEGTFRGQNHSEASEEQNILYVAVTRAKRRLVWVGGFDRKAGTPKKRRVRKS